MMFPFGKPVAEPTSDAIQASHGAAQLLHRVPRFPLARATFLRFCPSQSHLVGASPPGVFHRARRTFPDADRGRLWYAFAIVLSAVSQLFV